MRYILTFTLFFSFAAMACEFKIQDAVCGQFNSNHSLISCLIIIENETESAGVVLDYKYVMSKTQDLKELIGTRVEVELTDLLMLTLEEEEGVRDFLDYKETAYYSATAKEFIFLQEPQI